MFEKGGVNVDLCLQFYCQFEPRGLLQQDITFEGKKAQCTFIGRPLTGSVGGWLF